MSGSELKANLDAVSDALIAEITLLQMGRAKETAALSSQKLAGLKIVEEALAVQDGTSLSSDEQEALARVIRLSKENALHFEAVRNGIKSIIQRLTTLDQAAFVGAYGATGTQLPFSGASGGYLKKI